MKEVTIKLPNNSNKSDYLRATQDDVCAMDAIVIKLLVASYGTDLESLIDELSTYFNQSFRRL
jgi:hypothetical protein